jgi:hypothetical protein
MKTHWLKHDHKAAAAKLKGQHPAPSHADEMVDQDTVVIAPDGSILAVLIKQQIDGALYQPAYEIWKTVRDSPGNRAAAVGSVSLPRLKKDGTLSPRNAVPKNVMKILKGQGVSHGLLGYVGRTAHVPRHKTRLTVDRPEMLDMNRILIERVDELYSHCTPKLYAKQRAVVDRVPDCRLWTTAFTTTYIIAGLRCAYHADAGNLLRALSAITPMGEFTGGELVLARWRIAIAFKPGDLLLFDPQQLHGNLPVVGERLSAIFYCARRIADGGDCSK